MNQTDLDYFYEKEIHRDEEITGSIDCLHDGNPFVGTLILTDQRLAFVRKAMSGYDVLSIKFDLLSAVEQRIDRGADFMLLIELESFAHEFELRAIGTTDKQAFVDLINEQLQVAT